MNCIARIHEDEIVNNITIFFYGGNMTPVNFSFIIFIVWQFDAYQEFVLKGQICSLPFELLKGLFKRTIQHSTLFDRHCIALLGKVFKCTIQGLYNHSTSMTKQNCWLRLPIVPRAFP